MVVAGDQDVLAEDLLFQGCAGEGIDVPGQAQVPGLVSGQFPCDDAPDPGLGGDRLDLGLDLVRGPAGLPATRSSTPASFSIVTGLNPRATHDARNASTHSSWNRRGSAAAGTPAAARLPSITRNPGLSTPHTFSFLTPEKTR